MRDFKLTQEYLGWQCKRDITNTDSRFLALGSKNVLVNDKEKIVASPGYTLDGQASPSSGGSCGKYDWITSKSTEINLRCLKEGKVQYRKTDSLGVVTYVDIFNIPVNSKPRFAEWWSDTEKDDFLLFVVGDKNLYMWTGGMANVSSTTSNSITKSGTELWKENKFSTTGTVVIGGTEYQYTGGAGTTTLTGVTPDPSSIPAGSFVYQKVITHPNFPSSVTNNNYIAVHKNQMYLGSDQTRTIYISKNNDYTNLSFSSPRLPGEGALLTLDAACKGFVTQEDAMYIAAGTDMWFQTAFTLSSDNTKEAINVQKLKSGPMQGAISQDLITQIKNSVIYVSNEPTLDTLGRVENINTPQSKPLSDPIKPEFKRYDFNGGNMVFFESQTFISLPAESIVLIYDHENQYWQPPQTMSVILSIINGKLYGHSTVVNETYKLFDEDNYTHNGNPIESIAAIVYNNYGERDYQKTMDEYYWEGYASLETKIDITYKYDFGGFTQTIANKKIDLAKNSNYVFYTEADGSMGKVPLGKNPLGSIVDSPQNMPKFRAIQTVKKEGFYELQVIISTQTENYKWQIISHGPNTTLSTAGNNFIKEKD